ncbi:MAG: FHA domain-containing protein [Myxococcales bacterium]|nr:FHA domain-containing protein [Myxococcales bacterium]
MASDERDSTPLIRPPLRLVTSVSDGTAEPSAGPDAGDRAQQQALLREQYLFGARLLLHQPAACRNGYRLFWVRERDLGWIDLEASPENYAVLGYHEQCDLQLPKRPTISNRHVLASCFLLDGSVPALRLLDLHTSHPFSIDGQPRSSICVLGPLLIGLGDCALGCVPLPEFHQKAGMLGDGQELPPLHTIEADLPPEELEGVAASRAAQRMTHVTILPRSRRLEDAVAEPRSSVSRVSGLPASPGFARLTLQRQQRAVSLEISEADLYAGVMIGRSESCLDRGLRQVLSGQISRLHLLLLAEKRRVYAMDLCSTNGTWYRERRARRVLLSDEGTRLVLSGNDSKVELTWHPRTKTS